MAKVKNVSPLGDLYIPAIGLEIAAGETVEVPDELAASLLEQPSNWVSGDSKKETSTPAAAADSEGE